MLNKRQTGTAYEERAAAYLEEQGMQILQKNYRCRQGEIDLIAKDGTYLVFVEVKYRRDLRSGHPSEAVDFRKQKRILYAARYFYYEKKIPESMPCRFDVVSILGDKMEYIRNAFEYS